MPSYRTPTAKMPAKSEFELLSAGFPEPSPYMENMPVNPDLIPRSGVMKDMRFNRVTSNEQARMTAYNTDLSRKLDFHPKAIRQPLSLLTSENEAPHRLEKPISIASSDTGENDGNGTVDLAKGWPEPPLRSYGPPRSTTRTSSSRDEKNVENTSTYGFKKYGPGGQALNKQTLSPTTRNSAPFILPTTFGPSTLPTPTHLSSFAHIRGTLPVDTGFNLSIVNGTVGDSGDGIASVHLSESHQHVLSPSFDEAAALALSASEMIGCNEENVKERMLDQAEMLTEYKVSKLEETKIDADAVRHVLAMELMGWTEFLGTSCPPLRDLMMMPKNDFYRFFSKTFVNKDSAQDLKDFQAIEAQRFNTVSVGKAPTTRRTTSPILIASEASWPSDDGGELDLDGDSDDGDDVVFDGRPRLSTPSVG